MALSPTPDRRSPSRDGNGENTGRGAGWQDGPQPNIVTPAEDIRTIAINNASWGAILAGVALSLIAQVLLNMVGIGIGAGVVDPSTGGDAPAASSFSIGAGLWWTASGIVAAFIGGCAAGRLSGKPDVSTAAWHGLTTWAVTTLLMLYLLTTAVSSIIGGSMQMLGSFAGQATQSASRAVGGAVSAVDPLSLLEARVRASSGDKQAQVEQAVAEIRALALTPSAQQEQQRQRAVQALSRALGVPPQQANAEIQQFEQQYREAVSRTQRTAASAAGTAAQTVTWSALLGALALALGAMAAWFGGRYGAVDPTITPMARLRAAIPSSMQGARGPS